MGDDNVDDMGSNFIFDYLGNYESHPSKLSAEYERKYKQEGGFEL
jgi:hypothetical protein